MVRRALRNPVRLLLLVCAVAVATTLVASVLRVSVAGVESFEDSLGLSAEEYPLVMSPRGGRIELSELDRCLGALRSTFDIAAYRREAGEVVTPRGRRAVAVVGLAGVADDAHRASHEGELLVSERTERELNIQHGSKLEVVVEGGVIEGELGRISHLSAAIPSLAVLVPLSRLPHDRGKAVVDAVLMRPRTSVDVQRARGELAGWIASCGTLSVPVQVDTSTSRLERGESLVAAYRFNVMIMAGMTLLVCALLVSQATQLSLRNLSRELSVLRTLGVSRFACLVSVVQEAALVGCLGAVAGITLGEPLIVRITELFLQTAHDIYSLSLGARGSYYIGQRGIVVVGMVMLSVSGAVLGGLEALRVAPSVGTRSEHSLVKPISRRWASPLAALSIVAWFLVAVAAYRSDSVVFAYLFVGASIAAVAGVTPYVLMIAPRYLNGIDDSLLVWFARGGIVTGGRGFLLGAVGATLSMSLICALSLMVGSFRDTLDGWAAQRLQGDLFVSAALEGQGNEGRIRPHLSDELRRLPGVLRVIPYYETMTTYRDQPLVVSASNLADQLDRGIFVVRSGDLNRALLLSGAGAMASESAARKLGVRIGDTLNVEGRSLTIVAIIQEFGTEHPLIQINDSAFASMYPMQRPENLTIDLHPTFTTAAVRAGVEGVVGSVGIVRDNRELRDLVLTLFDRTFRITLSIRWIVFGIALLGLVLASLQHLWERRREIKTMHVLGFSVGEIVGAHVVESVVVCALPVLVGLFGGVGLGWGLTALVNPRSFGWSLHFSLSFAPVVIAVCFIVGVGVVVGLATRSVLRRTIDEATLSDE
jgi:putative ABC transport system permease protein